MSKKNTPSPCKTCSKTFCSDNGPCEIREKKNSAMADALRRLAQLCKQEREDNGGKKLCEQCWNCPIASVCSSYLGSKPLEDMANEAILSIENGV